MDILTDYTDEAIAQKLKTALREKERADLKFQLLKAEQERRNRMCWEGALESTLEPPQ